eukprot:2164680-Pleurochrysis_carterae.AAC.1
MDAVASLSRALNARMLDRRAHAPELPPAPSPPAKVAASLSRSPPCPRRASGAARGSPRSEIGYRSQTLSARTAGASVSPYAPSAVRGLASALAAPLPTKPLRAEGRLGGRSRHAAHQRCHHHAELRSWSRSVSRAASCMLSHDADVPNRHGSPPSYNTVSGNSIFSLLPSFLGLPRHAHAHSIGFDSPWAPESRLPACITRCARDIGGAAHHSVDAAHHRHRRRDAPKNPSYLSHSWGTQVYRPEVMWVMTKTLELNMQIKGKKKTAWSGVYYDEDGHESDITGWK